MRLRDNRLLREPLRLQGDIAVRNIAYKKMVTARYSHDLWETWSDSSASYIGCFAGNSTFEKFRFELPVSTAHRHSCGVVLCVKYEVAGMEYCDNNERKNYEVVILQRSN